MTSLQDLIARQVFPVYEGIDGGKGAKLFKRKCHAMEDRKVSLHLVRNVGIGKVRLARLPAERQLFMNSNFVQAHRVPRIAAGGELRAYTWPYATLPTQEPLLPFWKNTARSSGAGDT